MTKQNDPDDEDAETALRSPEMESYELPPLGQWTERDIEIRVRQAVTWPVLIDEHEQRAMFVTPYLGADPKVVARYLRRTRTCLSRLIKRLEQADDELRFSDIHEELFTVAQWVRIYINGLEERHAAGVEELRQQRQAEADVERQTEEWRERVRNYWRGVNDNWRGRPTL